MAHSAYQREKSPSETNGLSFFLPTTALRKRFLEKFSPISEFYDCWRLLFVENDVYAMENRFERCEHEKKKSLVKVFKNEIH